MIRRSLALGVVGISALTIVASCFLTLSYLSLRGLSDVRPLMWLTVFVAQSALTLVILNRPSSGPLTHLLGVAGALGLGALGWALIQSALSAAHFEGYALVMGALGVVQSVLTVSTLAIREHPRNS